MRHLLNTLFVTSEDIYLSLDGENVVANREKKVMARYPLHTLSAILSFSYPGASPALMGACAQRGISMAFCISAVSPMATVMGLWIIIMDTGDTSTFVPAIAITEAALAAIPSIFTVTLCG